MPAKISVGNFSVALSPAPAATVKGTIYASDLEKCTAEMLREDQLLEPVAEVRTLRTRYAKENSGRFLITFNGRDLPDSVKLRCGLILPVKPHVPVPLRCRRCFKYGHHEDSCSGDQRCPKCSLPTHAGPCIAPAKCIACGKEHAVTSTDCPKWKREMEINKIRFTEGVSSSDAAQAYRERTRVLIPSNHSAPSLQRPGLSFANIVAPATANIVAPSSAPADTHTPVVSEAVASRMDHLEDTIKIQSQLIDKLNGVIDRLSTAWETQTLQLTTIIEQNQRLIQALIPEKRPASSSTGPTTRGAKKQRTDSTSTATPSRSVEEFFQQEREMKSVSLKRTPPSSKTTPAATVDMDASEQPN